MRGLLVVLVIFDGWLAPPRRVILGIFLGLRGIGVGVRGLIVAFCPAFDHQSLGVAEFDFDVGRVHAWEFAVQVVAIVEFADIECWSEDAALGLGLGWRWRCGGGPRTVGLIVVEKTEERREVRIAEKDHFVWIDEVASSRWWKRGYQRRLFDFLKVTTSNELKHWLYILWL